MLQLQGPFMGSLNRAVKCFGFVLMIYFSHLIFALLSSLLNRYDITSHADTCKSGTERKRPFLCTICISDNIFFTLVRLYPL